MKKEVLETLQYLINDREIVGEELQLTNEAFLSLTTKEKIDGDINGKENKRGS